MRRIITFLGIIAALFLFFSIWWKNSISSVDSKNTTSKIFVVKKGDGIREIASNLKKEGLIKNSIAFFIVIKRLGLDGKIQAGDFRLSKSMDAEKVAQILTHGTLDIWITIPEGKRADQIADTLEEDIPSYKADWRDKLIENEGYLFPDTYLIPKDASIDLILATMKNNFEKKYDTLQINSQLSKSELVTIASLVEREAKFENDRPLVASVIINRLKISMALQIDATIQYALGNKNNGWWKRDLTKEDLRTNSPYNTYSNTGLPPTPISNPGLDVLEAVANPAKTDYLYYISDSSGHNHYAKTLEQHNANIRKYGL